MKIVNIQPQNQSSRIQGYTKNSVNFKRHYVTPLAKKIITSPLMCAGIWLTVAYLSRGLMEGWEGVAMSVAPLGGFFNGLINRELASETAEEENK